MSIYFQCDTLIFFISIYNIIILFNFIVVNIFILITNKRVKFKFVKLQMDGVMKRQEKEKGWLSTTRYKGQTLVVDET